MLLTFDSIIIHPLFKKINVALGCAMSPARLHNFNPADASRLCGVIQLSECQLDPGGLTSGAKCNENLIGLLEQFSCFGQISGLPPQRCSRNQCLREIVS